MLRPSVYCALGAGNFPQRRCERRFSGVISEYCPSSRLSPATKPSSLEVDAHYLLGEDKTKRRESSWEDLLRPEVLMSGTGALRLGPVARKLISPDKWNDGYPGPVAYSRELD